MGTEGARIRSVVLVALFSGFTALGAFVRVPLPTGVPFTLQVPAVLLAGYALGPGRGAASQLCYVAAGLLGLPVFAAGGGPGYLMSPTFGFLVGFVAAAFVVGLVARPAGRAGPVRSAVALLLGIAVIYLVGVPWFAANLALVQRKPELAAALAKFALVYLPLDVAKAALVLPVARVLSRRGGVLAQDRRDGAGGS